MDELELQRRARDWAAVHYPPTVFQLVSKAWAAGYRQCLEDLKENGNGANQKEDKHAEEES